MRYNHRSLLREDAISGHVIQVIVCVDDELDWEMRQAANLSEQGPAAASFSKVSITATPPSPTTNPAFAPASPLASSMAAQMLGPMSFNSKGGCADCFCAETTATEQ